MLNPMPISLNPMAQAIAGSAYKGTELQSRRDSESEKMKWIGALVFKNQQVDASQKPTGTQGRQFNG